MVSLDRSFGREAFGDDPANYHSARPAYPQETWAALRERAGLRPGIEILEIGAGTGLATLPLLAAHPAHLTAVEPDPRLADFLRATAANARLDVVAASFEDADLAPASFDLAVSATAFHWLDARSALPRLHTLLRQDGALALVWNIFGDDSRPDPFHEATTHLFAGHRTSYSGGGTGGPIYGMDMEQRLREMTEAGFQPDPPQFVRWTLSLDAVGVRNLYATYSNVTALAATERTELLDALARIAAQQFGGRIDRKMTTEIYTARRVS